MRANETELDDEGTEQPRYPVMKEALEEHFTDKSGKVSSNGIGYFLRQYAGRIIAGARFEAYGGNAARSAWRIVILSESQFKSEKAKFTDLGKHPNNPNHPNPNQHPNPAENAGNPHSTVEPPTAEGWDGCHSWDIPPSAEILPEEISVASADDFVSPPNPLDTRILAALAGSPAGFDTTELHRQIGNDKGTSIAMIEAALLRLVKAGDVTKVSGKWVSEVAK